MLRNVILLVEKNIEYFIFAMCFLLFFTARSIRRNVACACGGLFAVSSEDIKSYCIKHIKSCKFKYERKYILPLLLIVHSVISLVMIMSDYGGTKLLTVLFSGYIIILLMAIINRYYIVLGLIVGADWALYFRIYWLSLFSLLLCKVRIRIAPSSIVTSVCFIILCVFGIVSFIQVFFHTTRHQHTHPVLFDCLLLSVISIFIFCMLPLFFYFLPSNSLRKTLTIGMWFNATLCSESATPILQQAKIIICLSFCAILFFLGLFSIYFIKKDKSRSVCGGACILLSSIFIFAGVLSLQQIPNYYFRIIPKLDYDQLSAQKIPLRNLLLKSDGFPLCIDSEAGLLLSIPGKLQPEKQAPEDACPVCTIKITPVDGFADDPNLFFFIIGKKGQINIMVENQGKESLNNCSFELSDEKGLLQYCFPEKILQSSCESIEPLEQRCIFTLSGFNMDEVIDKTITTSLLVKATFDSNHSHWTTEKELSQLVSISPWDIETFRFYAPEEENKLQDESEAYMVSNEGIVIAARIDSDNTVSLPHLSFISSTLLEIEIEFDPSYDIQKNITPLPTFYVLYECPYTDHNNDNSTWGKEQEHACYQELANGFLKKRFFNQAIRAYSDGISNDPDWVMGYANRGDAYSAAADALLGTKAIPLYENAISDYLNAVDLGYSNDCNERIAKCLVELTDIYLNEGQISKAIETCNSATKYDNSPEVKRQLEELFSLQEGGEDPETRNARRRDYMIRTKWSALSSIIGADLKQTSAYKLFGTDSASGTTIRFFEDGTFTAYIALQSFSGTWMIENGVPCILDCSPSENGQYIIRDVEFVEKRNGDNYILLILNEITTKQENSYQLRISSHGVWETAWNTEDAKTQPLDYSKRSETVEYKASNGILCYEMIYDYPIFSGITEAAIKLNEYYSAIIQEWEIDENDADSIYELAMEWPGIESLPFFDSIAADVVLNENGLLSIKQTSSTWAGGAHIYYYTTGLVLDVSSGKKLDLDRFLVANPQEFHDILLFYAGPGYEQSSIESFYLTESGIVLIFWFGDALPREEVTIPYTDYKNYVVAAKEIDYE